MFAQNPFYHGTIKNVIVAFGNLFTDIHIRTKDSTGDIVKIIKCPISYTSKQQWYQRLSEDPEFVKKFEISLPRLSFEETNIQYNPSKKIGNQYDTFFINCGLPKQLFSPVPYRLSFSLYSYTKNKEDALQILEQILPYFSPALTVNIVIIPEINLKMDIPISLSGISTEDNAIDLENNRMIVQTFNFDVDVNLFGPYDSNFALIKKAIVDLNQKSTINSPMFESYSATVNPYSANKTDDFIIDEMWDIL